MAERVSAGGSGSAGGRGRGHAHGWGRQSLPESADDRRRAAGPVEIELDLAGELAALKERINALAEQVASSTTGNH